MGTRRLAIEAKTFDISLEQSGSFFQLSILESRRGFLVKILLGREAALWLTSTMRELNEGRWNGMQCRRFRDYDKMFLAYVGMNQRGKFFCITEFFSGGRKLSIIVPEGIKSLGWSQLGRALMSLLVPRGSDRFIQMRERSIQMQEKAPLVLKSFTFADAVKGKKEAVRGGGERVGGDSYGGHVLKVREEQVPQVNEKVLNLGENIMPQSQGQRRIPNLNLKKSLRIRVGADGRRKVEWVLERMSPAAHRSLKQGPSLMITEALHNGVKQNRRIGEMPTNQSQGAKRALNTWVQRKVSYGSWVAKMDHPQIQIQGQNVARSSHGYDGRNSHCESMPGTDKASEFAGNEAEVAEKGLRKGNQYSEDGKPTLTRPTIASNVARQSQAVARTVKVQGQVSKTQDTPGPSINRAEKARRRDVSDDGDPNLVKHGNTASKMMGCEVFGAVLGKGKAVLQEEQCEIELHSEAIDPIGSRKGIEDHITSIHLDSNMESLPSDDSSGEELDDEFLCAQIDNEEGLLIEQLAKAYDEKEKREKHQMEAPLDGVASLFRTVSGDGEDTYERGYETEQLNINLLSTAVQKTPLLDISLNKTLYSSPQVFSNHTDACSDVPNSQIAGNVCGSNIISTGILPIPMIHQDAPNLNAIVSELPKENTIQLCHLDDERDDRDPQALLDKLNFQLLDKSGKQIKVQITPKTHERKKKKAQKELQRLVTTVNYGGSKVPKGKANK